MGKFNLIQKERILDKVQRLCQTCDKDYDVYAFFGDEAFYTPLECEKCFHLIWYDYFVDKFFDEMCKKYDKLKKTGRERYTLLWAEIESNLPPCIKCGGKYRREEWFSCGAPTHCPHCRVSQVTNGTDLPKNILVHEGKVQRVTEQVWTVVPSDAVSMHEKSVS